MGITLKIECLENKESNGDKYLYEYFESFVVDLQLISCKSKKIEKVHFSVLCYA